MAARTTAAVHPTNGGPRYIGGGANEQDGKLKLYTCNTCHGEVVWATSTRTGNKYLANVFTSPHSGARFYVKASAHECKPALDIPAGPTEAHIRSLNAQVDALFEIREDALEAGDTDTYEKARAKSRELRAKIRELEGT